MLRGTAQVSHQASWFEEKDREPDRQGVPGARQEQPSDIQLPGIILFPILKEKLSLYMGDDSSPVKSMYSLPVVL